MTRVRYSDGREVELTDDEFTKLSPWELQTMKVWLAAEGGTWARGSHFVIEQPVKTAEGVEI